jgi:nitroimidazol reductase NimA-like FMN-containing flavoprotein (pyridoxamine 5'-phosphate oxidase superfamily)
MARKRRAARRRRVTFTKRAANLLRYERVSRVATAGAGGMPHVVAVCHVLVGDRLYFGSGENRKIENLRENPKVALTVDVYTDAWDQLRGATVQGRARLIERGPQFRRIRDKLYAKYAQYRADAALSPSDSVIVELIPTSVFSWGLDF